jgi:glyoxylase-like metal-dependent hydrolase (beta-lactamase superfamily II)
MQTAKRLLLIFLLVTGPAPLALAQGNNSLKLYVLDLGELESNPASYNLQESEVGTTSLSLSAYLIVHPDGVLLWEAGAVPESERVMEGTGARQIVIRSDKAERPVTLGPPMLEQMAQSGYTPADVTHLALSHFHWDHTANANLFAHAAWLVRPEERAVMFPDAPMNNSARPMTYASLRNSNNTVTVNAEEHDVFGDGRVILKAARGHSAGHQVLYLDLANTGAVVLSGDLYHFPEERSLDRLPVGDYDVEQTRQSRIELEGFLARRNATLWIEHDLVAFRQLRKAPAFYD